MKTLLVRKTGKTVQKTDFAVADALDGDRIEVAAERRAVLALGGSPGVAVSSTAMEPFVLPVAESRRSTID